MVAQGAPAADIDVCFRNAVDIARRRQTKLQELKATTSWARWLDSQGRRDEARAMLAAIYDWFTEGFDTKPLQDAKVLLDRLGASPAPRSPAH
jgi:predicted ATPase